MGPTNCGPPICRRSDLRVLRSWYSKDDPVGLRVDRSGSPEEVRPVLRFPSYFLSSTLRPVETNLDTVHRISCLKRRSRGLWGQVVTVDF